MLLSPSRAGLVMSLVAVAVVLPREVPAQSLGEAAQREKERRQAAPKKPVRTFSDADLPRSSGESPAEDASPPATSFTPTNPPKPSPAATPAPRSEGGGYPGGLPDDPEARRQLERTWKARFGEARANLRAADARAWRTKLEVVWRAGMPYQTEVREKVETEELKQAKQALDDLEVEFRRTGLPAGWSRD